jgi:hypothetical protein
MGFQILTSVTRKNVKLWEMSLHADVSEQRTSSFYVLLDSLLGLIFVSKNSGSAFV